MDKLGTILEISSKDTKDFKPSSAEFVVFGDNLYSRQIIKTITKEFLPVEPKRRKRYQFKITFTDGEHVLITDKKDILDVERFMRVVKEKLANEC